MSTAWVIGWLAVTTREPGRHRAAGTRALLKKIGMMMIARELLGDFHALAEQPDQRREQGQGERDEQEDGDGRGPSGDARGGRKPTA